MDLPNAAAPRAAADARVVATVEPNPLSIWNTVNAYQQTSALRAAVELDVFTAIGEGATTAGAIAARASASERGIRILSDYLVTAGLLGKNDGRYHLTPDSAAFLDRRSPAYMGGILQFINSRELMRGYDDRDRDRSPRPHAPRRSRCRRSRGSGVDRLRSQHGADYHAGR